MIKKPETFDELKLFYQQTFRPLYDFFLVELGDPPQELHFEISAAMDHLMRGAPGSPEALSPEELNRVCAHLKRATFDAFKLLFEEVRKLRDELVHPCYKHVDNGAFIPHVELLWDKAKSAALEARKQESLSNRIDVAAWGIAFEKWLEVRDILAELRDLKMSDKVCRSKDDFRITWWWQIALVVFGAVLGAVLGVLFGKI